MASFFAGIARQALAISGLAILLEVLLPKGNIQKCARLVLGVMLVSTFMQPVFNLLPTDGVVTAAVFTDTGGRAPADDTAEIIAAGGRLAGAATEQVCSELADDMALQIKKLVCAQAAVADCTVEVNVAADDGAVLASTGNNAVDVAIMLSISDNAAAAADEVAEAVKADVAAFYGLPTAAVRVSVVEYGR